MITVKRPNTSYFSARSFMQLSCYVGEATTFRRLNASCRILEIQKDYLLFTEQNDTTWLRHHRQFVNFCSVTDVATIKWKDDTLESHQLCRLLACHWTNRWHTQHYIQWHTSCCNTCHSVTMLVVILSQYMYMTKHVHVWLQGNDIPRKSGS